MISRLFEITECIKNHFCYDMIKYVFDLILLCLWYTFNDISLHMQFQRINI